MDQSVFSSDAELLSALPQAEMLFVLSVRWWVRAGTDGETSLSRLHGAMRAAGTLPAAFTIDKLMSCISRATTRTIRIGFPCCVALTEDECHILNIACLVRDGDKELAERALREVLLMSHGEEIARISLEELHVLFAALGLRFIRRGAPPRFQKEFRVLH
jgi:hypothetical protein